MASKTIEIIGDGSVGGALARGLSARGHDLPRQAIGHVAAVDEADEHRLLQETGSEGRQDSREPPCQNEAPDAHICGGRLSFQDGSATGDIPGVRESQGDAS